MAETSERRAVREGREVRLTYTLLLAREAKVVGDVRDPRAGAPYINPAVVVRSPAGRVRCPLGLDCRRYSVKVASNVIHPLRVVAAVIADDRLILACRRAAGRVSAGQWEFPGGKIEVGETPESALTREIREELGTDIEVVAHLTTDDTEVNGRVIRLECYLARFLGDAPSVSSDHDAMAWVRSDQLGSLNWALPDLPAVRLLASGASGLQ